MIQKILCSSLVAAFLCGAPAAWPKTGSETFEKRSRLSSLSSAPTIKAAIGLLRSGKSIDAFVMFHDLASAGNSQAMVMLAKLYEEGTGTSAMPAMRVYWLINAAGLGQPQAMLELGLIYQGGKIVEVDVPRSVYWLEQVSSLGSPEASVLLGAMYFLGEIVDKNVALALDCYLEAANHGSATAMSLMGAIYLFGSGVKSDPILARFWLERAAMLGDRDAQNMFAVMSLQGDGVAPDAIAARAWWLISGQGGSGEAKSNLLEQDKVMNKSDAALALELSIRLKKKISSQLSMSKKPHEKKLVNETML